MAPPSPGCIASQGREVTADAWKQNAVVLGYDIHGKPWYWPDKVRVMQGVVLGMTGSGKTTLLKNIITQDMARVVGTPEDPHRLPMVIFDGKGDLEFFYDLLPHVHRAGRLHQLRVLNPALTFPSVTTRSIAVTRTTCLWSTWSLALSTFMTSSLPSNS